MSDIERLRELEAAATPGPLTDEELADARLTLQKAAEMDEVDIPRFPLGAIATIDSLTTRLAAAEAQVAHYREALSDIAEHTTDEEAHHLALAALSLPPVANRITGSTLCRCGHAATAHEAFTDDCAACVCQQFVPPVADERTEG